MTVPIVGGSPEIYTEEMVGKKFKAYLEQEGWRERKGNVVPTIVDFADFVGTSDSYIHDKADRCPWLSQMLKRIKAEQRKILINLGLSGEFNSTITKLMLSQHGIHETKIEERRKKKAIRIERKIVHPKEDNDG